MSNRKDQKLISYDDCLRIFQEISHLFPYTGDEEVPLASAVDRVLAQDVVARENNPPFDNSAMDGFALNLTWIRQRSLSLDDWLLVQGVICAGDGAPSNVSDKGVIEIMTGAPIPSPDFDSVIRIESVETKSDADGQKWIRLKSVPLLGDNIRRIGEDMRRDDLLLRQDQKITREHLLVLASQGVSIVRVKKRIKIAILSTGKEIVSPSVSDLKFGQIRNSTGLYLEAALAGASYDVQNYGIIGDDPAVYRERIEQALSDGVDLVMSTGAVSMGVRDFVCQVLEGMGARIHFHKCAIRPGKPLLFSSIQFKDRMRFIFGIPGNPISTLVGFRFFIQPFLDLLLTGSTEKPIRAVLSSDLKKPEGLRCFLKARLDSEGAETVVAPVSGQGSFMVGPMIRANGWIVLPEPSTFIRKGSLVEVFNL